VIRDGQERSLPADQLVVGDIVPIRSGARVPADIRIIHCNSLKLETSSITGESEAIEFTSEIANENVSVFDAKNIAFNGSFCMDGEGVGVVIRIGDKTVCIRPVYKRFINEIECNSEKTFEFIQL
jgi:magnesium-transporting ATPase (P-type)